MGVAGSGKSTTLAAMHQVWKAEGYSVKGAALAGIAAKHGMSSLTEVHRQHDPWQRQATQDLSAGKTGAALAAYDQQSRIIPVQSREEARTALLARWAFEAKRDPQASQLVLAYTRADVRALNESIRALRQHNQQLGTSHRVTTDHGTREFAPNDRIRFGRNDRSLGVKNGSLGTVEKIKHGVLQIRLDDPADTRVAVDTKFYKYLDHGYPATVHKAQGTTVDRTYVLASVHFDRHTAYVALSRHRQSATLFCATDDFGGRAPDATEATIKARFIDAFSRERAKDLVHDYLEPELVAGLEVSRDIPPPTVPTAAAPERNLMAEMDARRQAAAERWAAKYRQGASPSAHREPTPQPGAERSRRPRLRPERGHDGPEDDLE